MDTKQQLIDLLEKVYNAHFGTKNRAEMIQILENIINNLK